MIDGIYLKVMTMQNFADINFSYDNLVKVKTTEVSPRQVSIDSNKAKNNYEKNM